MAQAFGEIVHRLVALYGEKFGDSVANVLFGFVEFRQVGRDRTRVNLVGQVVAYRIRQHEITVGQTLHQGRSAQAVGAVVGEVALADRIAAFYRGHQFVVHPDTAHRIVHGRIDHHRGHIRIIVGDHLVHLEKVSVFFFHHFPSKVVYLLLRRVFDALLVRFDSSIAVNSVFEVQIHSLACSVHTVTGVAALFGGTRSHVARNEVAESRIAAFQIKVAVCVGNIGRFFLAGLDRLGILFFSRYPDTAVVTQRFGHQGQLGLVVSGYRDTRRVYLGESRIGEISAALKRRPGCRTVGTHRIGRKEEYVSVSAGSQHHGMGRVAFDLSGNHIADDDTAGLSVHYDHVEHFVAVVRGDLTLAHLALECGIATQQELLTGLSGRIERTRYLCAAEGAVVQLAAVIAGERYALCDALVDDMSRNLSQTVYVGLAGTVVTAFDRIVEQTERRVAVVRIVFIGIDTTLCGDGVRAAGGILIEESLYVVTQLGQRSGRRATGKAGSHHDDIYLTLIGRVDQAHVILIVFPFLGQRSLGNLRIEYIFAHFIVFI